MVPLAESRTAGPFAEQHSGKESWRCPAVARNAWAAASGCEEGLLPARQRCSDYSLCPFLLNGDGRIHLTGNSQNEGPVHRESVRKDDFIR